MRCKHCLPRRTVEELLRTLSKQPPHQQTARARTFPRCCRVCHLASDPHRRKRQMGSKTLGTTEAIGSDRTARTALAPADRQRAILESTSKTTRGAQVAGTTISLSNRHSTVKHRNTGKRLRTDNRLATGSKETGTSSKAMVAGLAALGNLRFILSLANSMPRATASAVTRATSVTSRCAFISPLHMFLHAARFVVSTKSTQRLYPSSIFYRVCL